MNSLTIVLGVFLACGTLFFFLQWLVKSTAKAIQPDTTDPATPSAAAPPIPAPTATMAKVPLTPLQPEPRRRPPRTSSCKMLRRSRKCQRKARQKTQWHRNWAKLCLRRAKLKYV